MNKLKVGIAGYGIVGKRRHFFAERNSALKIVAVCDQAFKENGIFPDGVHFYSHYRDLISLDLDILIVCLTNDMNPEVTIAGLERGMHVFCEKPPGRNLADIQLVRETEKKYPQLRLMYGFNHRFHDSVQDALAMIQSGQLGKIVNLRGMYGKSKVITFNQTDWRTNRSIAGGGVLLDQGIHMVDLMRLFAGEFLQVQSFVANSYWGYDVEDNAYALMQTANGVVGMLHSSATQWRHRFKLEVNLESGSVILGGLLTGTKSYGAETLTVITVDHENDNGDPREQTTLYNRDPSWEREINQFVDCILNGSPVINGSSKDAFNTMKLVTSIYYADPIWRSKFDIQNPEKVPYE
jgi:predicted dehydrogenase